MDVRAQYNALLAKEPPKGAPCKNMKTFLLCCALVVFLIIIMIVVAVETNKNLLPQTQTCQEIYGNDPDAGPVGCRVCQEGARSNDISHFPFRNLGFQSVSHNLGLYTLIRVNGSVITSRVDPQKLIGDFTAVRGGSTPDDPGNYVQALGVYFVFAILMGIITIIAGLSVLTCKFCCNCACCGRRYPTEKSSYLGFEHMKESNTFEYSTFGVWVTRVFMATFAFFLALWLGLGQINGNLAMTSSMKSMSHAPDGLVSVIRGVVPPVAQLLENLISKTFVGLFQDLNYTITNEVNLAVIIGGVECILDLLGGFPTSGDLRLFVDELEASLTNLTSLLSTRVPAALDELTEDLDGVRMQVTDLRDFVNGAFAEQLEDLIGNLTVLQNQTDEFNAFTAQMLDPTCCASKANQDLDALQASSSAVSEAQYDDMIQKLSIIELSPTVSPTPDWTTFIAEMNTTRDVMAGLPNYNNSADNLDRHNSIVREAIDDRIVSDLVVGIEETNEFLEGIQGFTDSLNKTVETLAANVSSISLDPIRSIILDFNRTSYDLPDFGIVFGFIGIVAGIKDTLFPCMLDVSAQLKLFDENVAELPQQFLDIDGIINTVNETLQPALDTIETVKERQADLEEGRNKFNITKQLDTLTETEEKLANYTDSVTNNDYLETVRDAENKANLNITVLAQVKVVNESLLEWIIPEQNISVVRQVETPHSRLNQDLPVINRDLPLLLLGYCANNLTRWCRTPADCLSSTCTSPTKRCLTSTTLCDRDTLCSSGGGGHCLADSARLNRTRINLALMRAVVHTPSGTLSGIGSLLDDADNASHVDTSSLEMGIIEANNSLRSVKTGSLTTDLNNVIVSLNEFNTSDFSKEIDEINATLNSIDFESILEQLDSLDESFRGIDAERKNLDLAQQFLNATKELFFTRLPQVIESFSASKLQAIRRSRGVAATLEYLAETVDRETAWLDEAAGQVLMNSSNGESSFATNFTSALAQYKDLIFTLCDSNSDAYGSTYYLYQLANSFSASPVANIFTPDGTENRIDTNKAGQKYPGGEFCVTSACLENTIEWVNSAPLSEVSGGMVPVNMSREQVIGLPYLVPLAIMICATISTLLFCKSPRVGWWSSCLASCTCFGAFCCMPIIFIIVGMTFPLVIVTGDMCYSAENVGYNVLNQQGPQMCEALSGSGPINRCVIPWTLRNETHNATIDIMGTYSALVAPGCNPNAGAIYDGFEQAKDVFAKIPGIIVASLANNDTNTSNGLPINFRWPVKRIFVDAAADLSTHTRTFGTGLQKALSCSELYKIYSSFKGAFCCEVVSAFYWALGSWYLIAWTLLCCGCCAGLLGRKRFAYDLWGEEILQLNDKAYIDKDIGDDDRPRGFTSPAEKRISESVSVNERKEEPRYSPELEYVAPPKYEPLVPAYSSSENKEEMELEMIAPPSSVHVKTVEDF